MLGSLLFLLAELFFDRSGREEEEERSVHFRCVNEIGALTRACRCGARLRKGRHRLAADHGKKRNTAKRACFVSLSPIVPRLAAFHDHAAEERERDGTAIERPPVWFARGIGSSKKEPGGPDRRTRRRAPSYQTFEPTSSSLSLSLFSKKERPRNVEEAILEFGFRGASTFPSSLFSFEEDRVVVSTTLERGPLFALRPR